MSTTSKTQVYAVVRLDLFQADDTPLEHKVTVKEIVPSVEEAEREVERLNALRRGQDDIVYFWQTTRYYPNGRETPPAASSEASV